MSDRAVVALGLFGVAGLGWLYIVRLSREMADMAHMAMPQMRPWGPEDVALTSLMWAVMMVAMMVPAASPMILIFDAANRKRLNAITGTIRTGLFLLGYLLVWAGFSVLAAFAQWGLHAAALISPAMDVAPWLGGLLLVAAGIYQFTPLKDACLSRCQSPFGFILTEWREGASGALVMGLRHGLFCVGCCWVLMVLLFVAGVMNLLWVAAIAAFVLLEKVLPFGRLVSRLSGAALVVWGGWLLARAL